METQESNASSLILFTLVGNLVIGEILSKLDKAEKNTFDKDEVKSICLDGFGKFIADVQRKQAEKGIINHP
jgi:hypothetical protein